MTGPPRTRFKKDAETLSTATKRIAELEEALNCTIQDVIWFNSLLTWALSRPDNVPHGLLSIIRESASKRLSKATMRRGESIPNSKLKF